MGFTFGDEAASRGLRDDDFVFVCDLPGVFIPHPPPYLPSLRRFMLPGFIATMKALTAVSGRSCSWICIDRFAPFDLDADRRRQGFVIQSPQLNPSMNSRPGQPQLSLFISIDLLTIPSPTTTAPFPHDRFDTLRHRRELPRLSPGQTSPVRGPPSRGQGFAHS